MADEIPADIRTAAEAVVERGYNDGLLDAVIRALLIERQRCARIAETTYAKDAFHFELGTAIADAIRGDIAQELVDQAQKLKMGYE